MLIRDETSERGGCGLYSVLTVISLLVVAAVKFRKSVLSAEVHCE